MQVAHRLCRACRPEEFNDPVFSLTDEEAYECCLTLRRLMIHWTPTPVGLGSGHQDAVSKAKAATHSLSLACSDVYCLSTYLKSMVSLTTDMGAEMCMASLAVQPDLYAMAPVWMAAPCTDGEDESCCLDHERWLPNALTIPGMLHVIHNASRDIDLASLEHFSDFYSKLKNAGEFLCCKAYRDRFIVACLRPSTLSEEEHIFFKGPPSLHEARWNCIHDFIEVAHQQLLVCRIVWNSDAYREEGKGATKGFNIDMLSETLMSSWFFSYLEMFEMLHNTLDSIRAWAEHCPCHLPQQQASRLPFSTCPLASLRAPECACGDFRRLVADVTQQGPSALLQRTHVTVSVQEWHAILADYDRAVSSLRTILALKTSHWERLPWLLVGAAHFCESKARDAVSASIAAWDALPENRRESLLMPSCIHQLMSERGPHRQPLQAWVAGNISRENLPGDTLAIIAGFNFIPISERYIEAKHSIVKRHGGYHRAGPAACSMALRGGPLLESCLARDPAHFADLVSCFADARRIRKFATSRGLVFGTNCTQQPGPPQLPKRLLGSTQNRTPVSRFSLVSRRLASSLCKSICGSIYLAYLSNYLPVYLSAQLCMFRLAPCSCPSALP